MKKSELRKLIKEIYNEGFQGDESIGDGLSGFRGNLDNKDTEHEKKIDSILYKPTINREITDKLYQIISLNVPQLSNEYSPSSFFDLIKNNLK